MTDNSNITTIEASSLNALRAQVAKLNRKAVRLGLPEIVLNFGPVHEAERNFHTGEVDPFTGEAINVKSMVDVVDVEIPDLRLQEGWEFIGTIEQLDSESTVALAGDRVKLSEVPERFFNAEAGQCDHCGHNRRRKETFIVRRGDDWKQIGKTCMKDFLGISPQVRVFFEDTFATLAEFGCEPGEEIEWSNEMKSLPTVEVHKTLVRAIAFVDCFGFVSKKKAQWEDRQSSRNYWAVLENFKGSQSDIIADQKKWSEACKREGIEDEAQAIIDRFTPETDRDNEFLFKLGQICRSEFVHERNVGLLLASVPTFRRELAQAEDRKKAKDSQWVGTEKERLRNIKTTFVRGRTLPDYGFGESAILTFRDAEGNLFEWKTGTWGAESLDKDEEVILTGTVKEHREWKGIKSTALSRCNITRTALSS